MNSLDKMLLLVEENVGDASNELMSRKLLMKVPAGDASNELMSNTLTKVPLSTCEASLNQTLKANS